MELTLDDCLTTVYTIVDDLYQAHYAAARAHRPGAKGELSESEVLTLVILSQSFPFGDRRWLTYVRQHWGAYFPHVSSQSAYNRRMRALTGVLLHLGPLIGREVAAATAGPRAYEVFDGVPVPLAKRCRGQRHRCFDATAAIGRGGSDRDWFYGVKLLLACWQNGVITGFVIGPASTEEHWLAEAFLRWRADPKAPAPTAEELAAVLGPSHRRRGQRVGPTGPVRCALSVGEPPPNDVPYVVDLGLRGRAWRTHWRDDYGATVLTTEDYAALPVEARRDWRRRFHGWRQVIETLNELATDLARLSVSRARTVPGLLARLGAKIAAINLFCHLNRLAGFPAFSYTVAFLTP